jgi:DNA topoisomerase 2-associated protein PAT1
MRYAAQHAPSRVEVPRQTMRPKRTGYEFIPQLEADADLWGLKKEAEAPKVAASARKALTLEEVEAMLADSRTTQVPQPSTLPEMVQPQPPYPFAVGQAQAQGYHQPPQILQRPHQHHQQHQQTAAPRQQETPNYGAHHHPQILQRPRPPSQPEPSPQPAAAQAPTGPKHHRQHRQQPSGSTVQPRQILQNPNRLSGHGQPMAQGHQPAHGHARGSSLAGQVMTAEQFQQMPEEDKQRYLQEEEKRAKRNHKIHLLSKHNGIMTPQDKNFITRIQLQNLMTATGNVDAETPEEMLNEDFYYQVYNQIRGAPRQNPHQPANSFAQTYLFQTGGRFGRGRNARGADNHMQRMEQQVQRAVEAARAKPKNKQLVIEGSLGKISFSNSKTPKPLVNIKRMESESKPNTTARRASRPQDAAAERRTALKAIEQVYSCLMSMEDHVRHRPMDMGPAFEEWKAEADRMNATLWTAMRANEPFIAK